MLPYTVVLWATRKGQDIKFLQQLNAVAESRCSELRAKKTVDCCALHALDGIVNVFSRRCKTEGCGEQPSFGVAGRKMAEYCAQNAPYGMVEVCSKK